MAAYDIRVEARNLLIEKLRATGAFTGEVVSFDEISNPNPKPGLGDNQRILRALYDGAVIDCQVFVPLIVNTNGAFNPITL